MPQLGDLAFEFGDRFFEVQEVHGLLTAPPRKFRSCAGILGRGFGPVNQGSHRKRRVEMTVDR